MSKAEAVHWTLSAKNATCRGPAEAESHARRRAQRLSLQINFGQRSDQLAVNICRGGIGLGARTSAMMIELGVDAIKWLRFCPDPG